LNVLLNAQLAVEYSIVVIIALKVDCWTPASRPECIFSYALATLIEKTSTATELDSKVGAKGIPVLSFDKDEEAK
jgi:hypothetical protein